MQKKNKLIKQSNENVSDVWGASRVLSRTIPRSVLSMCRLAVPALLLAPLIASAAPARGQSKSDGPWLRALSEKFVVVDMASADLNGDGSQETAVCYREPRAGHSTKGGLMVLKGRGSAARPAFHAQLEAPCTKVNAEDGKVGLVLERKVQGKKNVVWTYGRDIVFKNARNHPLAGVTANASSSIRDRSHQADALLDGDLRTSWAEGDKGTGIGETVTITLPRATDVAYIGIFAGHGSSERSYFDYNRLHRGSLKVRTADDMGDDAAGIDFADLGIDLGGERVEFSVDNQPGVRYVPVNKQGVVEIELRLESVYLGKRHDDTHIAEIEIVPVLAPNEMVRDSTPIASRDVSSTKKTVKKKAVYDEDAPVETTARGTSALRDLDGDGRGLIIDDDDL